MAKLLLDRYLADIQRLAEALTEEHILLQTALLHRYANLHRINSIVGRALQEAEFELEQAERETNG